MNTYKDFPDWPVKGYGFIYFLRSPSGKGYVGQTMMSISRRIGYHTRGNCRALHNAIEKYGIDNFFVGVVGCYPIHELNTVEVRFIKELGTLAPDGYNLRTGGNARNSCCAETRRRISEAKKGKSLNLSPESRQRWIDRQKGRVHSEETKRKIAEAHKGKPRDAHTREVLIKCHLGKHLSAEHRQKIGMAGKGRILSAEAKERMSVAQQHRHPISEEARRNMSAGQRKRYHKPTLGII
jgi:group I intron endonuclease